MYHTLASIMALSGVQLPIIECNSSKSNTVIGHVHNIWGSARENWASAIFFKFSNLTVFGYRIALSTKQFLRIQNWIVYQRATKR